MAEHWATKIIRDFEAQRLFGTVVLRFKNGRIYVVEETRTTLAPPDEKNSEEIVNAKVAVR